MTAVRALVALAISSRRSGLISATCKLETKGFAAQVSARMPPHQPVPMMPTPIRLIVLVSSRPSTDACSPAHESDRCGHAAGQRSLDHRQIGCTNRDLLCSTYDIGMRASHE